LYLRTQIDETIFSDTSDNSQKRTCYFLEDPRIRAISI